jgi:hypothetical protein
VRKLYIVKDLNLRQDLSFFDFVGQNGRSKDLLDNDEAYPMKNLQPSPLSYQTNNCKTIYLLNDELILLPIPTLTHCTSS